MRKTLFKWLVPVLVGVAVTWYWLVEFSAFAGALAKALLGVFLLYSLLKWGHDEIDVIDVYRRSRLVFGLAILAYALVIAAALAGS